VECALILNIRVMKIDDGGGEVLHNKSFQGKSGDFLLWMKLWPESGIVG
jgi:hypothetical protein